MKIIEIDGIKYQLTPLEQSKQTLYEKLDLQFSDIDLDVIMKEVESIIPDEKPYYKNSDEVNQYLKGYNDCRMKIIKSLK